MGKLFSTKIESGIIKLGLYQIFGGAIGMLFIFWGIYKSTSLAWYAVAIAAFMLPFFIYSIFCGIFCLKADERALRHSLINQVLQAVGFAILGFGFKYVAGFYLAVDIDLGVSPGIDFGAGVSTFNFKVNAENERLEVGLNLIALGLIYWIAKLMKKLKEADTFGKISLIGSGE